MEDERFEFSPLRPILLLLYVPCYLLYLSEFVDAISNPLAWIFLIPGIFATVAIFKSLRLTGLMLLIRPAVILTEESIYVAEKNDTIKWTDVMDVYMASNRGWTGFATYYIIIRVREEDKYLNRVKNPLLRTYRKWTRNWGPSPFDINLGWVRGDEDELLHIVLRYFQNNRGF
jgi:hypothetical protein